MIVYPDAAKVLKAASRNLKDQLLPQVSGAAAFNLRVSINAIDLVCRELVQGSGAEKREIARLRSILASDESLGTLRERFCDLIASGDLVPSAPEVRDHMRATTLDRLAIDQPSYSAFRCARPDSNADSSAASQAAESIE